MEGGWVQSAPNVGLKRKSMSLNADGVKEAQVTYVGVDVLRWDSVTAISKDEKKELRKRLKFQLEQLEGVSLKITARQEQLLKGPDRVGRASNSDAHLSRTDNGGSTGKEVTSEPSLAGMDTPWGPVADSWGASQREARLARQPSVIVSSDRLPGTPGIAGKEKRTPKANQLYLNSEFVSGKDKMPPPEKTKAKGGVGLKRGSQGKADARDAKRMKVETARSKRMSDIMKQCATLLKKLISHKHAWVFNEPVDAVKLALHDYHKVIKKPMDLGTIKKKLENVHYSAPIDFADDVRLTFRNAMTYNPPGHDVYVMADALRELFEDRWKNIEEKLEEDRVKVKIEEETLATDGQVPNEQYQDLKQHLRSIEDQLQSLAVAKTVRTGGGRIPSLPKPKPDDVEKRPMTFEEKRKLSVALQKLPAEKLERIVQIIKNRNLDISQKDNVIEVDIDLFDNDTLWELDRFVTNCAKSRGKVRRKANVKEQAQRLVQDGVQAPDNGTFEHPKKGRKGGETGEEDVDIDDDMAPAPYPPVVIDKDAGDAVVSSSSSSSSSDSGSSSSDSDSGSSSGSDSEPDEPQQAAVIKEGSPEIEVPKSPSRDDVIASSDQSPPIKYSAAFQQADLREEGLPERQVSPEKLLRAALLRGRFADTILKAQEKTLPLNKNEKVDPVKLRKEREELERRQKEEKARLHAEAKAAEIAQKKAEEEAAAEAAAIARKRREVEREAARHELQLMEKTVDINENSEILKDLEMLRTSSLDHFPSSGDDTSPDVGTPDGVSGFAPGFAFEGVNPLQRLGLFIKDDEEEDYEGNVFVPQEDVGMNSAVVCDVEEGEID